MTIAALEAYYDAVPRQYGTAEEVGPFTLFVGPPGGWTFHARPRLGGPGPYDAGAVRSLLDRMRELGVPLALEWVHDVTPGLLAAVRAEGTLEVTELPLMVLREDPGTPRETGDVTVRMLAPHEEDLLVSVSGVQRLAFSPAGGTDGGPPGAAERDAAGRTPTDEARALLRSGAARIAVAEHPDRGLLAAGRLLSVGGVAEVVGVATLPAEQGAGLGSAVTRVLVEDARARGLDTVFLTAASERVAGIYRRLGFRRVGTAYAAEAAAG
jgi:ribosomal protein S18 acetylase RimI-like enzyme